MLNKNILCFIYNKVGIECLRFLIQKFEHDFYTVVFHDKCSNEVEEFKKYSNVCFIPLNSFVVDKFKNRNFDWLLSLCCGYIFPCHFLSNFEHTLNIHPGYLPFCKGNDPAVWTIQKQCKAGVTLHVISEVIDGGSIWAQEEFEYDLCIKGKELTSKLHDFSIYVFKKYWERIRNLEIQPVVQSLLNKTEKTHTRSDFIADTYINGESIMKVKDFILKVNSHDFYPKYTAICTLNNKKYGITLNLEEINE